MWHRAICADVNAHLKVTLFKKMFSQFLFFLKSRAVGLHINLNSVFYIHIMDKYFIPINQTLTPGCYILHTYFFDVTIP